MTPCPSTSSGVKSMPPRRTKRNRRRSANQERRPPGLHLRKDLEIRPKKVRAKTLCTITRRMKPVVHTTATLSFHPTANQERGAPGLHRRPNLPVRPKTVLTKTRRVSAPSPMTSADTKGFPNDKRLTTATFAPKMHRLSTFSRARSPEPRGLPNQVQFSFNPPVQRRGFSCPKIVLTAVSKSGRRSN
jgi:hypothetical protein